MNLSDRRSPLWPLPCDRCGRTVGCPCLHGEDAALAAARVGRRHTASVNAAATAVMQRHRRAAA